MNVLFEINTNVCSVFVCNQLMYYYGVIIQEKDGLSPRRKYMEFASRGVHHTYQWRIHEGFLVARKPPSAMIFFNLP